MKNTKKAEISESEKSSLGIHQVADKFHAKREDIRGQSPNTEQRLFRAIQWTKHGLQAGSMVDRIILLWIAFNALYGQEEHQQEKIARRSIGASSVPPFVKFLGNVVACGHADIVVAMRECQDACSEIIRCQYAYQDYWNALTRDIAWHKKFESLNDKALKNIKKENVADALPEVFRRVNVLRNQLFHGGAAFFDDETYNNRANVRETEKQREDESHPFNGTQIRACDEILQTLTPVFVRVVLNNDEKDWGNLSYPPQARPDQKTKKPARLR